MNNPYEQAFYTKLDKECQKLVTNCYELHAELSGYEENCNLELPAPYEKLKKNLHDMLKNYEENDQ